MNNLVLFVDVVEDPLLVFVGTETDTLKTCRRRRASVVLPEHEGPDSPIIMVLEGPTGVSSGFAMVLVCSRSIPGLRAGKTQRRIVVLKILEFLLQLNKIEVICVDEVILGRQFVVLGRWYGTHPRPGLVSAMPFVSALQVDLLTSRSSS